MVLRNLYYILRIIAIALSLLLFAKGFLASAHAQGLGFGQSLEILVVPVLGVPEFDYFFNLCVWFFLVSFVIHMLVKMLARG